MKGFSADLNGQVAVVTGGTGVLCGCMARALGAAGASVAVLGRRTQVAEDVAAEIVADGGRAIGVTADVLDAASLHSACERINDKLGTIDILINGAGGNHPSGTTSREFLRPEDLGEKAEELKTFFDLDPEGIRFVFDLNLLGTLLPTQVFSRGMAEQQRGSIINISSMTSISPLTKVPAYGAAKAAVNNLTQWLAVHFSRVGIRVNAIAPGFFLTDQNRALLTTESGDMTPRGQTIVDHTPMQRLGQPDELIGCLLWLASDTAAGFVTGTVIPIDGGFAAFSGV